MNYININLDDFILKIFSKEPGEYKTVSLVFENECSDVQNLQDLFQNLIYIFTNGLKILFSNNNETINIEELSKDDIILINKYFYSFGIEIFIKINNILSIESINEFDINNLPSLSKSNSSINIKHENKLKDFYFTIKKNNIEYTILFDFI